MKLYVLNATPCKSDLSDYANQSRIDGYFDTVAKILASHGIDGFTIYQVQGYWKGEPEVSFKIELAIDKTAGMIYDIAEELRDMYSQDSVMITHPDGTVEFE